MKTYFGRIKKKGKEVNQGVMRKIVGMRELFKNKERRTPGQDPDLKRMIENSRSLIKRTMIN